MSMGERLRKARLAAGLSQRQLCGEEITRNMLSLIEHDAARPSMSTLQYLAHQLAQPLSYFLEEEETGCSLEPAWAALEAGHPMEALALLDAQGSESREGAILRSLALLDAAEGSIDGDKKVLARQLLDQAAELEAAIPFLPGQKERRVRLLCRLGEDAAEAELPGLDGDLLLHARAALNAGDIRRTAALLEACEDHSSSHWQYLRGVTAYRAGDYASARDCLMQAEEAYPQKVVPLLEICFRELGDFRNAYFYSTKGRDGTV